MTEDDTEEGSTALLTPKKASLGRLALEKNAIRKALASSIQSDQLPLRRTDDRPSYNADALNELKSSTPSTPKELQSKTDIEGTAHGSEVKGSSKELDLAAKFGSDLAFTHDSIIPTDAEIREKKERRARLAKEHDFISLNDDQDEQHADEDSDDEEFKDRTVQRYAETQSQKYEETRLVRDDDDIAEGFDEFVEDGRIALGRKAKKEQRKRHEAEMRDMIEKAEGSDDSSEDESEAERRAAYEAAQTRAGMDGLSKEEKGAKARRPRTPPRISPLPSLAGCAERLRERLERKKVLREQKRMRMEEVRKELEDIAVRKVEVQRLLDEAGERYQELRAEAEKVQGEEVVGREILAQTADTMDIANGSSMRQTASLDIDSDSPRERVGLGMGI